VTRQFRWAGQAPSTEEIADALRARLEIRQPLVSMGPREGTARATRASLADTDENRCHPRCRGLIRSSLGSRLAMAGRFGGRCLGKRAQYRCVDRRYLYFMMHSVHSPVAGRATNAGQVTGGLHISPRRPGSIPRRRRASPRRTCPVRPATVLSISGNRLRRRSIDHGQAASGRSGLSQRL